MGDDETNTGYYWFDSKQRAWREYQSTSMGHFANIVYWTDADPSRCYDEDRPTDKTMTEAEKETWAAVVEAIDRYNVIKGLTQ